MPHKNKDTSNESISDMQNCLNHEERSIDTITFPYEENERLVSYDKNHFMAIKSGEKEGDYMDNEENKEINNKNEKRNGECDSKDETIGCNENGAQNGKNYGNGLCNENVGCNGNNDQNGKNYENGKNNENMGCRIDTENQVNVLNSKMMYNECEQEDAQNDRIARTENNGNNENARNERCSPKREIKMEDERKYSLIGENKENNENVKHNELREKGEYKCGDENEKIMFNSKVREMNLQFTDGETESHNNHTSYNYRRTEPINERDYNLNTNNASNGTQQREVNELESPHPIYSKNIEDTRMSNEPFDTENALASQKIADKRSYRQMHPSYGNDLQYNNFYNPANYGYSHADYQKLRRGREYTRMPYTYNDSHNYTFTNGYYGDFGRDGKYSMSENESYNYRNSFGSMQSTRSFSPFETKDYNDYNESKMNNGIFDKSYIEGRNYDNFNDAKLTDKTSIEGRNLDKSYNDSLKDNYNDSKVTIETKAYNDTISTRNESLLFNLPHASEKESCKNFDGTYAILRDNQFINCQSNIQHLKKRKSKTEPFEKNVKRMYVKGSRKRPERQSFEDKAFPNKEYTFDYLNYDQKKVKFVNEYDKYNYESQNVMQSRPFPESIPEYDNMYHDDTGYCDNSLQNNSVYTMPIHAQSKAFNSSQDHGDMSFEFDNVNNDCKQETDYVSSPSEYIYNCDPCMKKFKRLSTLKIHIFSHIKDAKIFKCPKTNCDSGFKSQAIAIKHIQHFHREERTMLIELLKRSKYITIFRSYTALIDYHRMLKLPNPFLETFCFGCFSYPRSMADHPCTRMFYNLQQCPSCKMDIESGKLDEHVYSEQCMRPGILTKEFENR